MLIKYFRKKNKKVDELRQKFSWKKDVQVIYHVETALWNENYDTLVFSIQFCHANKSQWFY